MEEVNVGISQSGNLLSQFKSFYKVYKNLNYSGEYKFNLKNCNFVYPLPILALCAHVFDTNSVMTDIHPNIAKYLENIDFPNGVKSVNEFQKYSSYIPIVHLENSRPTEDREKLETCFQELIHKAIGEVDGTKNAINQPIAELITNIFEHSNKNFGWTFAQTYPTKKFLDISIIDTGRGLKKGYADEKNKIYSDKTAIIKALTGYSIKKEKGRGTGIRSSIKVVCEGLNGSFMLVSGNSLYYQNGLEKQIMKIPNFYWKGVIVSYQIPFPKGAIDITPYY